MALVGAYSGLRQSAYIKIAYPNPTFAMLSQPIFFGSPATEFRADLNCRVSVWKEATCDCVSLPVRRQTSTANPRAGVPLEILPLIRRWCGHVRRVFWLSCVGLVGSCSFHSRSIRHPRMMQKDLGNKYDIRCVSHQSQTHRV